MNYDEAISDIVTFLKQDERVKQPWRNYATKHLQEAMAAINMGLTTTDKKPPDAPVFPRPKPLSCICTDDMPPRRDCPVHGTAK